MHSACLIFIFKTPFLIKQDLHRNESDWCDRLWNCTFGKYIKRDWFNPSIPDGLNVTYPFAAVYNRDKV